MCDDKCEDCKGRAGLSVYQWKKDAQDWQRKELSNKKFHTSSHLISSDSDIGIIFANADQVRECEWCRKYFSDTFHVPSQWWLPYYRNANGYFGARTLRDDDGTITAYTTWVRFRMKLVKSETEHEWYKLNIFTLWIPIKRKTTMLIFDAPQPVRTKIPTPIFDSPDPAHLGDPFWMYPLLAEEVVNLQDEAVWTIRNHVRTMEKTAPTHSKPNYRRLHDIARHAIHVNETLDLAVKSMTSILTHQADFTTEMIPHQDLKAKRASRDIRQHLLSQEHMLESLRYRSNSNKERLTNEIQLTFNNVAQHNSGTLVNISTAAQIEGKAMKTVAFITLVFLPSTFVSAIFSMSFFNYSADSGKWAVSDKFWMFWVFAALATLFTFVAYHWANISFVSGPAETELIKRKDSDLSNAQEP
ncbi:hypothetical protein F5884DRAFT_781458 [Xylogone sp. PMI_703]|nr:hypothetical protein F5884DRAFT_781458 [Xylogone sp. PMI_703]